MKYSISKREKNKIYYTSIKVKKHEEKHSKLGRPKKLQKKFKKKKTVTLQNCHASKKNYIKKNQAKSTKQIQKKRERKKTVAKINQEHTPYTLSLSPFPPPTTFFPKERTPKNPLTTRIKEIGNKEKKERRRRKKKKEMK